MDRFDQIVKENDECIERCISECRAYHRILDVEFDRSSERLWENPNGYMTKLYVTPDCEKVTIRYGAITAFEWTKNGNGKDEELQPVLAIEDKHGRLVEFVEVALPVKYFYISQGVEVTSYSRGMRELVGAEIVPIEFYDDADNFIACRINDTIASVYFYASGFYAFEIFDQESLGRVEKEIGYELVSIKEQIFELEDE